MEVLYYEIEKDNFNVLSFFLTERKKVLKERLALRGEKDIKHRLKIYKIEKAKMYVCEYIIINSDMTETLEKIKALVKLATAEKPLLPARSLDEVNSKRIDKHIKKLEDNKKVKPIKVFLQDGEVYIVSGVNRYLASLNTNKTISKLFLNEYKKKINPEYDVNEWYKIVNSYEQP